MIFLGTIIDDYTIISSAACTQTKFYYSINVIISNVSLFYPTLVSMINIFAGMNNISDIFANSSSLVKLSVAEVIPVIFLKLKLNLTSKKNCFLAPKL